MFQTLTIKHIHTKYLQKKSVQHVERDVKQAPDKSTGVTIRGLNHRLLPHMAVLVVHAQTKKNNAIQLERVVLHHHAVKVEIL